MRQLAKWMCLVCFIGLIIMPGCKTAEDAQYTLTVTVATGVTGTPVSGSYTYAEGEVVSYAYSLQTGYENLVVQIDGVTATDAGVITMNANHILTVTADEAFDVRGAWSGILTYSGYEFNFNFTFSGGLYSGTVNGFLQTIGDGDGTYTITNGTIEFVVDYPSGYRHTYTGSINNDNNMSGDWISNYMGEEGGWELDRD